MSRASFGEDAERFLTQPDQGEKAPPLRREPVAANACSARTPSPRAGVLVIPLLLDDRPAVLEVVTRSDNTRSVRALSCAGKVLAQASVPAR